MLKASASAVSGPFIGCSLLSCLARLCLPVPRNPGTAHRGQPPIVSGSLTVQGQVQDPSGSGGCPAGYHCPHRSGEWASEVPVFQSQGPAGHRKPTTAIMLSEILLARHCPTRIIFPHCTIAAFRFLEKDGKCAHLTGLVEIFIAHSGAMAPNLEFLRIRTDLGKRARNQIPCKIFLIISNLSGITDIGEVRMIHGNYFSPNISI